MTFVLTIAALAIINVPSSGQLTSNGIAALYPGDAGIETHPDVVFVEKFEENTLTDPFSRWTDILNGPQMTFNAEVPSGSPGTRSLNIPWLGGASTTADTFTNN